MELRRSKRGWARGSHDRTSGRRESSSIHVIGLDLRPYDRTVFFLFYERRSQRRPFGVTLSNRVAEVRVPSPQGGPLDQSAARKGDLDETQKRTDGRSPWPTRKDLDPIHDFHRYEREEKHRETREDEKEHDRTGRWWGRGAHIARTNRRRRQARRFDAYVACTSHGGRRARMFLRMRRNGRSWSPWSHLSHGESFFHSAPPSIPSHRICTCQVRPSAPASPSTHSSTPASTYVRIFVVSRRTCTSFLVLLLHRAILRSNPHRSLSTPSTSPFRTRFIFPFDSCVSFLLIKSIHFFLSNPSHPSFQTVDVPW